jgi:hypothetical protein
VKTVPNEELPAHGERVVDYAKRLESAGHDEIFIRKALRIHFSMELAELPSFMAEFEEARLLSVGLAASQSPKKTAHQLALKVSKSLGIPHSLAEALFARHFERVETQLPSG